ncbi:MAG: helix-turn-helix transcriptional regulator, partial [Gaiellaceae bacterium]
MRERRDKHKAARRREAAKRAAVEQRIAETGFIDRRTLARRAGLKVPGTSRYLRAGFLVPAERVGEGRTAVMLFRPEDAERLRARRRGELHPLREARLAAGLTQAELGELAGCKNTSISGIEAGAVFPSVELGKKLAANVGRTLEEVFGEPKPCACGCRELTFATYAEHHAITAAHQVRPAKWKAVEAYAAKHGLVDAENIGEGAGCHPTSVKARARAGDLGDLALRYPGEWSPESSRPWLFKPAAVGRMRELRSEWRDRQRATAKEAGKRNGPKLRAYWRTAEGQARVEKLLEWWASEAGQAARDRFSADPTVPA